VQEVTSNASNLHDFANGWGAQTGVNVGPVALSYQPGLAANGKLLTTVGFGLGLDIGGPVGRNYNAALHAVGVPGWIPSFGGSRGWVFPVG
jgi:hypothetical protein